MSDTQTALVAELGRRETAKDKVLRALLQAGERGVLNTDLNAICYRYGARVFELKAEGYRIDKEAVRGGLYRYTLRPQERLF